jgi:hypothetical protein
MCFAAGVLIASPLIIAFTEEHSYLAFLCGVALALFIMFSES